MAECCSGLSLGSWWPSFVLVGENAPWSTSTPQCHICGPSWAALALLLWCKTFWRISFYFPSFCRAQCWLHVLIFRPNLAPSLSCSPPPCFYLEWEGEGERECRRSCRPSEKWYVRYCTGSQQWGCRTEGPRPLLHEEGSHEKLLSVMGKLWILHCSY